MFWPSEQLRVIRNSPPRCAIVGQAKTTLKHFTHLQYIIQKIWFIDLILIQSMWNRELFLIHNLGMQRIDGRSLSTIYDQKPTFSYLRKFSLHFTTCAIEINRQHCFKHPERKRASSRPRHLAFFSQELAWNAFRLTKKIKASLGLRCYAKACIQVAGPSSPLSAWATQLQ